MHIYNIKTSVIPENANVGTIRHHRIKAANPNQAVLNLIRREQYPLNRTHFEVFRHGLRAIKHNAPIAVLTPSDFGRGLHNAVDWLDEFEKNEWGDAE